MNATDVRCLIDKLVTFYRLQTAGEHSLSPAENQLLPKL
ncbi:MAG: hypothetical protein ACI9BW_004555, partial [Gammaproteobacteria bacterium]